MATAPRIDADVMTVAADTTPTPVAPDERLSLIERMRREGYRFDFYQAVRLLAQRQTVVQRAGGLASPRNPIRFRPSSALSFPAADIARIDVPEAPHDSPTVVATFMGLYGVDSPLPEYFYEDIAVDEASSTALRDFLDIFAHRLYQYFYRAWERVRPEFDDRGNHARRFQAVAGLAHAPTRAEEPATPADFVSLAGRLAPRARGAEGLSELLRTVLDVPVRIEEYVPRWVRVDRTAGLGRGAGLGGGSMLGERIFDVSGKFRIWLGPMDLERYEPLLPGGPDARILGWVVRAHVPGYLDHDVILQLRTDRLTGVRLGDRHGRLGLTTCLGKPRAPVITRVVRQQGRHSSERTN